MKLIRRLHQMKQCLLKNFAIIELEHLCFDIAILQKIYLALS